MRCCVLCLWFLAVSIGLPAQKIKVACVGNSVTYGYLLPDRERNCYPAQLAALLGDKYEVGNFGNSGSTLLSKGHKPYIRQQEYKDALQFAGGLVVVNLGLNDTDPRNWPNYRDEFISDYLALIDSFRKANPACKIWICRMSPITHEHWRFKSGTRDWYGQIQKEIEQVSKIAGVGLVDLQEGLYDRPDLFPDALHPNVEGAGILAQTVYSGITGNYGGLQMPAVYADNMVLQRGRALKISGTANADEKVTVKIGQQAAHTVTGKNGKWTVQLKPLESGGPYEMTVTAKSGRLEYKNVLVGEVWLCSGQSNMAFMVKEGEGARQITESVGKDNVRLYNMKPKVITDAVSWDSTALAELNRLDYYRSAQWQACNRENVSDFSAIAYSFGKMLSDSLRVPVGLICNAVGGSPTEAWINRETLEYNDRLVDIMHDWLHNDMIQDWVRGRAALNIKNATVKGQRHPYEPCYLYATGIKPLTGFPIKGVIWYQGESNERNVELHDAELPAMVEGWRKAWGDGFPFYYVQLSGMNRPSWPRFRDSQRRLLSVIGYSGMAVSSDLGEPDNVHPRRKKEVGERLGCQALNRDYGFTRVLPSGPLYKGMRVIKDAVYVAFEYGQGMRAADGQAIKGFEIAGENGLFVPARAEVGGDEVKVFSPEVKRPVQVRYSWQPFPTANLVNGQELPASTFLGGISF